MNKSFHVALLLIAAAMLSACSRRAEPEQSASTSSSTTPPSSVATAGAACAAHGAPKELCWICDPKLRDPKRMWCAEHARYEDRCWLCHPELEDKSRLYCTEHGVYEDECVLCHPELAKKPTSTTGEATVQEGTKTAQLSAEHALICKEHAVPEHACGICHPDQLARTKPGEGLKVRLVSNEAADKAGVVVGQAEADTVSPGVEVLAELTFDQGRMAQITPLVAGVLRSVEVGLGSRVKEGDVLARMTSADIAEAQGAYLKAVADARLRRETVERERGLREERISSERDLQEAEAAHQSAAAEARQAKQQLVVLGMSESQVESLARQQSTPGLLEIRAPLAGEIVERSAVRGAAVDVATPLFTIADTSMLWAMVSIPEPDLSRIRVGQDVELSVASLPGEPFAGKLTWLSPEVDDRTRMTMGRVEVANEDGRLKANMFGRARISTSASERAVLVPQASVQDISGTSVVFVREAGDLFEIRHVRLGAQRGDDVEVIEGLRDDEPMALSGTYALKSQFLISRLGAGCTD